MIWTPKLKYLIFQLLGVRSLWSWACCTRLVSHSTCQIKWQNSYIYYRSTISTFKVIHRSTQGQTKMLCIMHLTVIVLFIYGYGAYWKHFQTYFMYVLYFPPCVERQTKTHHRTPCHNFYQEHQLTNHKIIATRNEASFWLLWALFLHTRNIVHLLWKFVSWNWARFIS